MFNAYVLYCLNTDRPVSRREFHKEVLMSRISQDRPAEQPIPGPAGDKAHRIEYLPRNSARKCFVCNKGKSRQDQILVSWL